MSSLAAAVDSVAGCNRDLLRVSIGKGLEVSVDGFGQPP